MLDAPRWIVRIGSVHISTPPCGPSQGLLPVQQLLGKTELTRSFFLNVPCRFLFLPHELHLKAIPLKPGSGEARNLKSAASSEQLQSIQLFTGKSSMCPFSQAIKKRTGFSPGDLHFLHLGFPLSFKLLLLMALHFCCGQNNNLGNLKNGMLAV